MRYRIAKKKLKRNTLLNLWLVHVKETFEITQCENNTLSELSRLVISISQKMLDYEYVQIKKIQKEMELRNFQFHHYVSDKVFK